MINKIAVLFSFEQNCFHIETMGEYIKSNIIASKSKNPHQFRLVGIADTWLAADIMCEKLKSLQHD